MIFVKEYFNQIYNKYATIHTLKNIMAIVTPILILKEQFVSYINSFIPSYVERIVHFDTEDGNVTERYIAYKKKYSMKNALYEMMDLPKDGYYMFVVWNNLKQSYEHFIFQANLVKSALEIRNVYNLWTLHDFAISIMLSNFVSYSTLGVSKIIGITMNGKDITNQLKPYIKCLSVPNNVRPNVLYMLSQYLNNDATNRTDMDNSTCTYITDDMDEKQINESNRYIMPSTVKNYPIYHVRPFLYECGEEYDTEDKDEECKEDEEGDEEGDEDACCECDCDECEEVEEVEECEEDEEEEIFENSSNVKRRKINILDDDAVADEIDVVYTKDKEI